MKNVAVIMGGYSSEYKISLTSGGVVCANLNTNEYKAFPVHILKEKWVCVLDGKEYLIDKNDFSVIINNTKITFDVVFNAIHGTPGEDGLMQAYFELLEIPHTSCDYYQAALTFNKRDLLSVLKPYTSIFQAPGTRPEASDSKIVALHNFRGYTAPQREQKTDFHDPDDETGETRQAGVRAQDPHPQGDQHDQSDFRFQRVR